MLWGELCDCFIEFQNIYCAWCKLKSICKTAPRSQAHEFIYFSIVRELNIIPPIWAQNGAIVAWFAQRTRGQRIKPPELSTRSLSQNIRSADLYSLNLMRNEQAFQQKLSTWPLASKSKYSLSLWSSFILLARQLMGVFNCSCHIYIWNYIGRHCDFAWERRGRAQAVLIIIWK